MNKNRVLKDQINIDDESVKTFYAQRAKDKVSIDIDAPVVLCSDKNPEKISAWTNYEIKYRLPLFEANKDSKVLELGFGTGRVSKYIIPVVSSYVGIDYVEEFVDIAKKRKDIEKCENTLFMTGSLQELVEAKLSLPDVLFNRFLVSGGVFMYMNDQILKYCFKKLVRFLDQKCLMYISEPIAMEERLTLNKFYSDNLNAQYSAIYRTVEEYNELFSVFYENGFKLKLQEEFFQEDIKAQKETKQWLFILER